MGCPAQQEAMMLARIEEYLMELEPNERERLVRTVIEAMLELPNLTEFERLYLTRLERRLLRGRARKVA
jgi:hypothetical protein